MDLVLEVCDTIFFDKVYAQLFPKTQEWPMALIKTLGLSPSPILAQQSSKLLNGTTLFNTIKSSAGSISLNQIMQASTQHVYGEEPFLIVPLELCHWLAL